MSIPEPTQWNGDYDVDHPSSNGRPLETIERVFWRSFAFCQRTGMTEEFLRVHRQYPTFAALVAEAERRLREDAA